MNPLFKPGLYAITPQRYPDLGRLCDEVRDVLKGGATMVQFRDKSDDSAWREEAAGILLELCNTHGAALVINDDVQLAMKTGASGVHLGRDDMAPQLAREKLGSDRLIGVSCYNSLDLARRAAADGADYLAFGSVFASGSKPGAVHCPPAVLTQARCLGLPVVAIGGITPDNACAVVNAGADSLAVIGAVFNAADVRSAAESFSGIWQKAAVSTQ